MLILLQIDKVFIMTFDYDKPRKRYQCWWIFFFFFKLIYNLYNKVQCLFSLSCILCMVKMIIYISFSTGGAAITFCHKNHFHFFFKTWETKRLQLMCDNNLQSKTFFRKKRRQKILFHCIKLTYRKFN